MCRGGVWTFELIHRAVFTSGGARPVFRLGNCRRKLPRSMGLPGRGRSAQGYAYPGDDLSGDLERSISRHPQGVDFGGRPGGRHPCRGPNYLEAAAVPVIRPRSGHPGHAPGASLPALPQMRSVELVEVLSTPVGIKAVVASTREVTVMARGWGTRDPRGEDRSGHHCRWPSSTPDTGRPLPLADREILENPRARAGVGRSDGIDRPAIRSLSWGVPIPQEGYRHEEKLSGDSRGGFPRRGRSRRRAIRPMYPVQPRHAG